MNSSRKKRSDWRKGLIVKLHKMSHVNDDRLLPLMIYFLNGLPHRTNVHCSEIGIEELFLSGEGESNDARKLYLKQMDEAARNFDSEYFRNLADILDDAKKELYALGEDATEKELIWCHRRHMEMHGKPPSRRVAKEEVIELLLARDLEKELNASEQRKKDIREEIRTGRAWDRAFKNLSSMYPADKP